MPTSCCAYGCKNRHVKGSEIKFFSFPFKDPHRLEAWVAAIRRKDWKPTKATRICSEHFTSSDFLERPGTYIKHLKPNAVPNVFKAFPKHLQPKKGEIRKGRNLYQEVKPHCEPSCSTESPNTTERGVFLPEESRIMDVEDTSSDNKESSVSYLRHKVRMLQQKVRRKEKKIKKMSTLLSEVKKKVC